MDWNKYFDYEGEKPLDRIVEGYSNTSIFRKIAFVGDSLSSGEFETFKPDGSHGYHDMFEYSWGQFIARKNGLTAYNFSRGGMTAREYVESFAEAKGFWSPDLKAQAYVIALGCNDIYNQHGEVGSLDDVDVSDYRNNKPTFLGYYATIVSKYKELVPDAKFFFVTLPFDQKRPGRAEQGRLVSEALTALAELFDNCYVIDLYKYAPEIDEKFRYNFYHGHLTPSGYVLIAKLVDSYIDYIIRVNPRDFAEAGFINSGIQYKF